VHKFRRAGGDWPNQAVPGANDLALSIQDLDLLAAFLLI
jgi:hypothetical protein